MPDWNPAGRRVLLDTHIWLWLVEGNAKINRSRGWREIQKARERKGLWISVISIWELALLAYKKRITLSMDCAAWVREAMQAAGLELQLLTPDIAILSTELGDEFHADPADRFLVATALVLDATLATADQRILDFAKKEKKLRVHPI